MTLYKKVERFSFYNRVGDPFPESLFDFAVRVLLNRKKPGTRYIVGYHPSQVLLTDISNSQESKVNIPAIWIRRKKRSICSDIKEIEKRRECYLGLFLARHSNGDAFIGKVFMFNAKELWFRTYAGEMRTWYWEEIFLTPARAIDSSILYESREKILEERIAELEYENKELIIKLKKAEREKLMSL